MPLREGDGTGFAPKGIAEVRTGGGNVLYSAGPSFPITVDDFEDGDTAEYSFTDGANSSDFIVGSDYAFEGGFGANISTDSTTVVQSSSGLDNYPARGNVFEFFVNLGSPSNTGHSSFLFAGNSDGIGAQGYWIGHILDSGDSYFTLEKGTGGGYNTLSRTQVSWSQGSWYRIEVSFGDPITTELFENVTPSSPEGDSVAVETASDNEYDSGDIGFKQETPGKAAVDSSFDGINIIGSV